MRILVSGSTGLIGSALVSGLTTRGHQVLPLVRRRPGSGESPAVLWDPSSAFIDTAPLGDLDAVVHLAGEPIAALRWTRGKKQRIRDSRVAGTRLLVDALGKLARPPGAFLCASASGYYGDRGEELLREDNGPGKGFLAEVVQGWEAEAARAAQFGMREVRLRLGIVLSPRGGALRPLVRATKLGLGATFGRGRQYMSWIALDDLVRAIVHVLDMPALQGPINVATPHPVTNRELTRTLASVLRRPALFAIPAFALRLALGDLARDTLLAGARLDPSCLVSSGFSFEYPSLAPALRHLLRE